MLPSALKLKTARNGPKGAAAPKKRKTTDTPVAPTPPKRQANAKAKLAAAHRRPLTTDELNSLHEATIAGSLLSNDNLFALQIDEILKASELPAKYDRFVYNWLNELNEFLPTLQSDAAKVAAEELLNVGSKKAKSAQVPWDEPAGLSAPAFHFQFIAPRAKATYIGSYATSTLSVGTIAHVDLAIEMPAQCFQKADYLNQIYHRKKALYVRRLATELRANFSRCGEIRFAFFNGDRQRPVLEIRAPAEAKVKQLRIFVHIVAEANAFKLSRFHPETSNVRASLFGQLDGADLIATPHYNAGVLRDLTLGQNAQFLQKMLEPAAQKPVREALRLAKLWLKARGLSAFGGHVLASFAVLLIKQRRVHVAQSAYDVLRQLWVGLAASRWNEPGQGAVLAPQLGAVELAVFHKSYDVVLVDVSGWLNVCAEVPLSIYLRVREEAQRALTFVAEQATLETFRHLFAAGGRPQWQQYDHVINVTTEAKLGAIVRSAKYHAQFSDRCGQVGPLAERVICSVLRRGFGKRADSITPLGAPAASWALEEAPPKPVDRLSLGVILNPEFCTDVLDRGPQADQEAEADEFKAFWGARSEMRRFQDGSIVEACVWAAPAAPLAERRLICQRIALHLLQHHFGIGAEAVRYVAAELDVAYRLDGEKLKGLVADAEEADKAANSEHLALGVVKAFDELGRQLRALDGIPLAVTAVTGAAPVFRYCEVEPIVAVASVAQEGAHEIYQSYAVLEAVIELASSGKWPDKLEAVERLKAAFCLRIAAGLREQNQLQARTNGRWVDVIKDGYQFRLRVAVAKELILLKKTVSVKGVTAYRDTDLSRAYERDLLRLPRLTQLLHTLYHQHSSFGPAVCIAKRWLRSQLIDTALWPDECTELLMARVYMQTDSWTVPAQPQAAFVRWLQLLASTDWHAEQIILNFNDGLTSDQLTRLNGRWRSDRDSFPILSIVTPAAVATLSTVAAETKGQSEWTVWTHEAPIREIVGRVVVLAGAALDIVERAVVAEKPRAGALEPKALFVPELEGYDVLIRLRRGRVQQSNVAGFEKTRRGRQLDEAAPAGDFNVVERYLGELREAYGELALFFYDQCGGDVVAVMWKPAVRVEREFSAVTISGCHAQGDVYVVNLPQIVEDFRLIGHGLVEKVEEA